jgi:hypothetical protein
MLQILWFLTNPVLGSRRRRIKFQKRLLLAMWSAAVDTNQILWILNQTQRRFTTAAKLITRIVS